MNEAPTAPQTLLLKKAVLSAQKKLHKYPIRDIIRIEQQLTRQYSSRGRRAILTRGVDDAIDIVLRMHRDLRPFIYQPTFEGFIQRLSAAAIPYKSRTLGVDYHFPGECSELSKRNLLLLANPNNPTGTIWSPDLLETVNRKVGYLFVDEAYLDFAGCKSFEESRTANKYVFRSFSKAFALAGLRLGVLIGPRPMIDTACRNRIFCPIDIFSLMVLSSLLDTDRSMVRDTINEINRVKQETIISLAKLGLDVRDSFTNFVLVRSKRPFCTAEAFRRIGILVRDTRKDGMPGWLRVSIRSQKDMHEFFRRLRKSERA